MLINISLIAVYLAKIGNLWTFSLYKRPSFELKSKNNLVLDVVENRVV